MRAAAVWASAILAACGAADPKGPSVGAGATGAETTAVAGNDAAATPDTAAPVETADPPKDAKEDTAEPADVPPETAAEVAVKPTGCATDFDCGAAGANCVAAQCLFHTKCQSDKQCQSVGQVCDLTLGECVPCAIDADCAKGTTCKGHVCLPPPEPCASTKECPNGLVCNKVSGQCVLCATSADCSSNQGCLDTVCVPKICKTAETKCSGTTAVGTCNAEGTAFDIADCASGKQCTDGKCGVLACTPDKVECQGVKVVKCNAAGSGSVVVKDCGQLGQQCNGGQCQANQVCAAGSASCKDGMLQVCEADGTSYKKIACGKGQVCIGQSCVEPVCLPGAATCDGDKVSQCDAIGSGWAVAKDCKPGGLACKAGFCAPACTAQGMVTAAKNLVATGPVNLSAVAATGDGGWALGGAVEGGKAWLVRTDSTGSKQWDKDFAWTGGYINAVAATTAGGVAAVGSLVDKNLVTCGALVLANADGSAVTDVPQCESANPALGNWQFNAVAKRSDNGLYLVGFRRTGTTAATEDFLVVRTDAAGKQLWQKSSGGTLSDRAADAAVLADDSVVAVGYSTVPAATNTTLGAMLMRFDSAGVVMWTKTLAGYSNSNASAVALTKGGEILVVGQAQAANAKSQSWVAQYGQDGSQKWQAVVGSLLNALLVDVAALPDGTFAAYQFTTDAAPNVLHLDASAAILHTISLPGSKDQQATQLAAAASGDLAAAVYSQYALKQPGKLMLLCGW